jgi:hypothetical protein
MNLLLASKACDITGVVGIACARHGCYAPNSLVDLFKGEQQKNVDFAFLKALSCTNVSPDQGTLLIYDIACQYFVHLQDWIGTHLPFGLNVEAAIGLFHVHAHKDDCFFRDATSFIPGASMVAGEILESLWSTLNSISPTARTATLAHRAEMLDDHANYSNHKKMLGIVSSICKSHRTATDMLEHAELYYENLTTQAGSLSIGKWTADIEEAEERRRYDLAAMDIYVANMDKSGPSRAIVSPGPVYSPAEAALERWIAFALVVEAKQ